METFSERIRIARRAAGLTQQQVADHFGIQRVSVTQWESGQSRPALHRISQLAHLFSVSEEWLLANKGQAPAPRKRVSKSKLAELVEGFPKLAPEDQDRLVDMMRRLSASAEGSQESVVVDFPTGDKKDK